MSGAFPRAACTGCADEMFLSNAFIAAFWMDDEKRAFPMGTAAGYCHSCGQLTVVGRPPVERHRTNTLHWMNFLSSLQDEGPESLQEFVPDFPDVVFDFRARLCFAPEWVGLCLRCRSHFVTVFPQDRDSYPKEMAPPIPTGIRHGCGGEIVLADSDGVRTWPDRAPRLFDLRGNLVWGDPLPWQEVPQYLVLGDRIVRI